MEVIEAHIQLEVVRGLYAIRLPLGWTLCGQVYEQSQHRRQNDVYFLSRDDQLHRRVEQFIEIESAGTQCRTVTSLTDEEARTVKIVADTMRLVNGRFETGLPWCER